MKISTRTRYGLRAMIDIALYSDQGPVLLKDIAKRQDISMKYLDHIITILKSAGFVKNAAGGHGGYVLTKPAEKVNVGLVVESLEGSLAPLACAENSKGCKRSGHCVTRKLWVKMSQAMKESLSLHLSELVADEKKRIQAESTSYSI